MVQFQITGVAQKFQNTLEGHQAFREAMAAIPGTSVAGPLEIKVFGKFTEEQLYNYGALVCKCWHHFCFMLGKNLPGPSSPWQAFRHWLEEASQGVDIDTFYKVSDGEKKKEPRSLVMARVHECFTNSRLHLEIVHDPAAPAQTENGAPHIFDSTISFRMFVGAESVPKEIVHPVTWRLANMGEWSLVYTANVRLSSETKMKWETFNGISTHLRQEIETNRQPEGKPKSSMKFKKVKASAF